MQDLHDCPGLNEEPTRLLEAFKMWNNLVKEMGRPQFIASCMIWDGKSAVGILT